MPDRHKETKSKYTLDRNIPGAFEGETVTRRRLMVLWANGVGGVAAAAFTLWTGHEAPLAAMAGAAGAGVGTSQ